MTPGIESLSMDIPRFGLDLRDLAKARRVDLKKYTQGIGQEFMSVPTPDEDVVTLGANAAERALQNVDRSKIRTVIFATESGVDQSKAAAIYVHKLLDLPSNCRTVEMKQACCSSTSALHFALASVAHQPDHKILLVAADIARYGLNSPGEPTQGGGAVAMVISAQPRILSLDPHVGYFTEDVMDFWRPNYRDEALVDGKYSIKVYLNALEHAWQDYQAQTPARFEDFDYFCYHLPFSRMGLKAHLHFARTQKARVSGRELQARVEPGLRYARRIGNAYTASLYMSLLSLLETAPNPLDNRRIGFFSYGSGCMGAFFGGTVLPGYQNALPTQTHRNLLDKRQSLSLREYEDFYNHALPENGESFRTDRHRTGKFRLAGLENHQRIYERVPEIRLMPSDAAEARAAAPIP